VLTIKNVTPAQGVNYFKQENYYSQEAAKQHSQWSQSGAAKFKLEGAVDGKAFKNLLEGYSPDRKQVLTGKENKKNHRAAYDCTFSAPKSVSLAALMGGHEQLTEAHKRAVARTLDIIEQQYAQARVWDGEKQHRVNTGNLIVAQFHHTTSREKDPQLHTHCVIINATQLPDGRWRALSNEELYRNKLLLGAIYRNELAQECRKLGYEIEKRPKDLFEIKGYTQQQLEHFSKRRQHIEALVGPTATAEEKQWAALYQRPAKGKELPLDELAGWWQGQDEALTLGIQHPVVRPEQLTQAVKTPEEVSLEATEAVQTAIEHCSERAVAFKRQMVEKFVLSEIKGFSYADLQEAITDSPELVQTFDERYTTQKALDRELATIKLMLQGKEHLEAIAHPEIAEAYLEAERVRLAQENKRLTQGQQEAVRLATTTQDQFVAICGVAGSGKTYSLQLLKTIAEAQGYSVCGFAPSGAATKVLGQELEMEANTIASLLVSKQPEQPQPKQLWIVDEAGLLDAKDGYKLLKRAREEGARIALVGDYRQNSAVEAGSPFRSLLSAGISTAFMDESLRQKNPELKQAADLAAAGQHLEALQHLERVGRIQPIKNRGKRTNTIAQAYLNLTPQERAETLILAGTHQEKGQIMHCIRQGLKAEGVLGEGIEATRLHQRQEFTDVQTRYTHNYAVGDVVVPVREYRRSGLHKHQPYRVEAIQDDKLLLSSLSGNQLLIDPMKFRKSVYQQEEIELSVGDRFKWTRTNKELGHTNGDEFVVTGLAERTATLEYEDGKTESLYLDQPLHLDYAIVSTTYSSQGKTADHVLISSTVDQTVSQESVYVAISRTRHDLKIFAEDVEFLVEQAQQSSAQENPIELLERKVEPENKAQVSITEAVIEAPAKVVLIPVREHPQAQPPVKAVQAEVEAPASRPKHKLLKDHPQPQQKPPAPKPQNLPPVPKPQPTTKRATAKPQKLQPFWIPDHAGPPPFHIDQKHWKELVEGSAIHPGLAERNVETVVGNEVYERLLSTKLEQIGGSGQYITQPAAKLMKAYEQVAAGGWWAKSGIDARSLRELQPGEELDIKLWGSFKADHPRVDTTKSQRKGTTEFIKYEHPLAEERQLFLFDVPVDLAQRIYEKHNIQPAEAQKQSGFWYVVHKYNLPITITEGAKKTLSSLSQGEVTIGLSGVNGGYLAKDQDRNPLPQRVLHPELKVFATPGREFRFAFDHDRKASTVFNVRRDMVRTGELLELEGCNVSVVQWKGDKGLDDLIVNQGPVAYTKAQANPVPLAWKAQKHYRGKYTRLSRQVRRNQPALRGEAIDVQVYKLAVEKGDIRDGDRVTAQSDHARSLRAGLPQQESEAKTLGYIQHTEQQIYQPTNPTKETTVESLGKTRVHDLAEAISQDVEQQQADPALSQTPQQLTAKRETLNHSTTHEAGEALRGEVATFTEQLSALQGVEEQQQPQAPQPAKLSPQQLWQQYAQRVQPGGSFMTALEVTRLAWRDGVPEAEIRQVLEASPHLRRFGEKGRRDLVELPLAKVKREVALSKMPSQPQQQSPHTEKGRGLGPEL